MVSVSRSEVRVLHPVLADDSGSSEGEVHTVVSTEEEVYLHQRKKRRKKWRQSQLHAFSHAEPAGTGGMCKR